MSLGIKQLTADPWDIVNVDYVEALGSPVISGGRIERTYTVRHRMGESFLATFEKEKDFNADASSVQGGVFDTVRVVFGGNSGSFSTEDGETSYSISNSPIARDIRLHEDFVCNWKYNLYQFCPAIMLADFSPEIPSWWESMEKPEELTAEELKKYRWGEAPPPATEAGEWVLIKSRTMQTDTYPYPAPVVQETITRSSRADAEAALKKVGTCKAPGKTFNYLSADKYWQITGSNSQQTGKKRFTVTTEYQYCPDGWDGRIIPGGDK